MTLRLIGHYDSPYVRRVAVSINVLGLAFERLPLSVFRHADALVAYNPLGRVPALVLDDGQCLIDSAAILDHLDQVVGPDRALLPVAGQARRDALQIMALATGANDKAMAIAYERRRAAARIDPDWIARSRGQLERALAELERRYSAGPALGNPLMQSEITVAAMLGYVRLREPDAAAPGRHVRLDALSAAAESTPAFMACRPTIEEIGGPPEEARAALLRLASGPPNR